MHKLFFSLMVMLLFAQIPGVAQVIQQQKSGRQLPQQVELYLNNNTRKTINIPAATAPSHKSSLAIRKVAKLLPVLTREKIPLKNMLPQSAGKKNPELFIYRKPVRPNSNTPFTNNPASCLVDTIILTSQAQVNNFATNYPACTTPKYLFVDGTGANPAITSLSGLSSITQVINKLLIRNTAVSSLAQMTGLTQVDTLQLEHDSLLSSIGLNNLTLLGSIQFRYLPVLASIAGLSNHITSTGQIYMDTTALTTLSGLSGLTQINGDLDIRHTPIANLSSLNNLTYTGYVWLQDDSQLTGIGLSNLTHNDGLVIWNDPLFNNIGPFTYKLANKHMGSVFFYNTALTNLSGMDSATSIINTFIGGNPNLVSLHGLEKINAINYGISIWYNPVITDLSALSGITNINNDKLEVSGNTVLSSLAGLGNITNIAGGLWLRANLALTTLSQLNPGLIIQSNCGNPQSDSVFITDNNQLALCSFAPICNFLAINSPSATIYNNAVGCSSIGEIIASCTCSGLPQQTWNGNTSSDWNDTTNWTPAGIPGTCTIVTIPDLSGLPNSPLAANIVNIGGLVMQQNALLDMGNFDMHVKDTLVMNNATINHVGNLVASLIDSPQVIGSTINGNFTCKQYWGHSQFYFNTINGNTVLSDSSARADYCFIFLNNYYGNLTWINNSDYGQNYLGNASPGNDYVQGDLNIINNSAANISLGLGGGIPIIAYSNLIINSSNGGVDINNFGFDGNNNQHVTQAGSVPIVFNNLFIQKVGGNTVTLDQPVHVHSSLSFTANGGQITSDINKVLILDDQCIASGSNNSAFVIGPIKKIGHQAFTFPTGDLANNTLWYAPLTITAPSTATDEFTARYFHHNPTIDGYDTSLYTPGFGGLPGKDYWKLDRNNGNAKVKVTLSYDSARSGPAYLYQYMQVAGWNGSLWRSWGTGGFSGTIINGTVISGDSLTQYGPLSLSYKPARKPVITVGNIDSIACEGTNFNVPFTLDTLMTAGNVFRVEVSDTLGHFNNTFNPTIGSKTTITSDTIVAYMPYYLFPYKHYKLRVVGSLLPDTSVNTRNFVPNIIPQLNPSIIGPIPACIGNGLQQYYPSVKEAGVSYTWTLTGGGSLSTNGDTAIINWTTTGTYNLTLHSSNHCGNGPQFTASILVRPPAPSATPVINNIGRWLYASQLPVNANYQWYRNGTLLAGAVNASYYASLSGNYTARFGNACGNGPVSDTISFAANSLPQTISFPTMANKTFGDAPFVPAATASSGLPVAFSLVSGPANINPQTNLLTITGTGLVTVRANQQGNNVYDTAAPVTHSFTVLKAPQLISFDSIPDEIYGTGSVTMNASSNSGLPVTFSVISGPATNAGNVLTLTGIGTVTVRASQSGDTNYLPATPVNRSFCGKVVTLNPVSGYTNLCPGTASYSVNNVPGATYFWRIAGGGSLASVTNTVSVTWSTPGNYFLIVSATGNCGAASTNDSLLVHVINSIQPDSVQLMLPPNGAVNQQLPLLLSWVPASPNNYYTFDLYLWRADTAQPATPYVAGLTTVNYTIPLNSGLLYNHAYKWMVVSHNGSCTQINTGPVQQFTLIPLPDLAVSNVQAPASAFSGQSITISWTVSNPGPGNTTANQNWTDAVFLSYDTLPNFHIPPNTSPGAWSQVELPVRPLLIGTRPNLTALNAGQSYTNSLNFTLPLNYSQPLYVYVITNYPAGVNAPIQVTSTNDTARAPQPVIVTLSPTPDLRVDTVFTPSTTFSGSTISLTYKVKNYGVVTPAGSAWTDRVYISQNPLFSLNTSTPIKFPKPNGTYYAYAVDAAVPDTSQLQADSVYTRTIPVVVPNYISGTWFIYVFTNADNTLYEGALANNNINRNQVQVFLTPTPHLTVNSLTVPVTAASTTQPIGVNWNIANTGFNDNIEKNKGHYFVLNGTCLVPPSPGTPGIAIRDSVNFGSSYWVDRVYLSTDSTGLNTNAATLVNESTQGQLNSGLNVPDNFNGSYPCQPTGTNPAQYNVNAFNVIKPASNHPQTANFIIPANLPAGNYYVYVLANAAKNVFEYPGLPETKRSALPITIHKPDAVVSSVTVPANSVGGQPISINYSILNNGPGAVFNHDRHDRIYVSNAAVFDGSAQLISTQSFTEDLPVGIAVPHSVSYNFPVATSGTRYFYVYTNYDSLFLETNSNNNISTGAATTVTPAVANDLVVTSVVVPDSSFTKLPAYFKYTVANNGAGTTAGTWTDSLFVSCSATFSPGTSYYIGKRLHSEIVPGGSSYTDSFYLNLDYLFNYSNCFPALLYNTAYCYVKTNADNVVYEGVNTNNNVNGTGSRTWINALVDQIVTTVSGPDSAVVGRPYPISWTVKNLDFNPNYPYYYNAWFDGVYFSPDSVFTANAVAATAFYENTLLNHNQTYSDAQNAIPPNLPTGDYYVFVNTNTYGSIIGELVLNNNNNLVRNISGAAKKIHLTRPLLPDLVDTILSSPASVALGQPLNVVTRITNQGSGATYPNTFSNRVWLSTDFIPGNGNDYLISGTNFVGVLQAGQTANDTAITNIPIYVPPGNYILISQVNATGNVIESNNANNLAFKFITVYSPAPSDLIVENITHPDSVYLGYTLDTARWVVHNISPNTAYGISSDGIYLSTGTVLDSTAVLLGIKNKTINMAPLSRDTISMQPLVGNVIEGSYNVLVKTDVLNNIIESNKNNNTGVSATPLYVGVKELLMNILTPNTLSTTSRYYKLIIPDSLAGSTIQVILRSNDSLSMNNQMFIGKGYVPSAAHFDYSYSTPNYGNQDIVISSVTSGVYYICIRCVSPNPLLQNITVKAVKLPFSILSVNSASGGNTGNVTVRINGSLFTNNMTAKLTHASTTIVSSAVYFSNSTVVYATFNLRGQPLGIYDVSLIKADSTTAVLPNGFSVVPADNGGLITGGGINVGPTGNGNDPGCDPGAASGLNSQLVIQMVAPDKAFGGWPFIIQINYNNPTNVDIPAQVRVLYSQLNILMALTSQGLANGTMALHMELTEQNGPPGIIRAGGSGTITVYAKAPVTIPGHTRVFFNLE